MKIYVHYEAQEPEFTLAVNLAPSDGRTAKELKHEFIEAYAKRCVCPPIMNTQPG
jgi:hypothetical protein